jgi:hypothetical protein
VDDVVHIRDEDIIADGGTQTRPCESLGITKPGAPSDEVLTALASSLMPTVAMKSLVTAAPKKKLPPPLPATRNETLASHADAVVATPEAAPPRTSPLLEGLASDDLSEETRTDRTRPFDRSRLAEAVALAELAVPAEKLGDTLILRRPAWLPSPLPRPNVVLPPAPPLSTAPLRPITAGSPYGPPPMLAEQEGPRSSTISPLAVDVAPPPSLITAKYPTIHPQHAASIARAPKASDPRRVLFAAIAGGVWLCVAAGAALVVASTSASWSKTMSLPTFALKAREGQKRTARSVVIEAPNKVESVLAHPDDSNVDVLSSAPASSEVGALPVPPVAATPAPEAPAPTTGAVEVPSWLTTVMVDGEPMRVQDGRIVVACGRHNITTGLGAQLVDVPCGGAVAVK